MICGHQKFWIEPLKTTKILLDLNLFIITFREEATSALAGFHVGPLSWSNWNFWSACFCGGGKPENPDENPRSKDKNQQQTQPTYDTGPELNPSHIGRRRALSPLRHPCSTMLCGQCLKNNPA